MRDVFVKNTGNLLGVSLLPTDKSMGFKVACILRSQFYGI